MVDVVTVMPLCIEKLLIILNNHYFQQQSRIKNKLWKPGVPWRWYREVIYVFSELHKLFEVSWKLVVYTVLLHFKLKVTVHWIWRPLTAFVCIPVVQHWSTESSSLRETKMLNYSFQFPVFISDFLSDERLKVEISKRHSWYPEDER